MIMTPNRVAQPPAEPERRADLLARVVAVMGQLPNGAATAGDLVVDLAVPRIGYTRLRIRYPTPDGDLVPAWLLVPAADGPHPAALCLHQSTALGKDEPAGIAGNPQLWYARELAEEGWVTLAPDYPGFGDYRIDPYAMGYASASMKAIRNNIAAVDVLVRRFDVDPTRIAAIGHSLGGHNAIFTAVFDRRIGAVVSSCGFTSFGCYRNGDLSGWAHRGYMPRLASQYGLDPAQVPFDFDELIGALAPTAFLAVAPTGDDNFDVGGVRECMRLAACAYERAGVPDRLRALHPEGGHEFAAPARAAAYRFLDDALAHPSTVARANRAAR